MTLQLQERHRQRSRTALSAKMRKVQTRTLFVQKACLFLIDQEIYLFRPMKCRSQSLEALGLPPTPSLQPLCQGIVTLPGSWSTVRSFPPIIADTDQLQSLRKSLPSSNHMVAHEVGIRSMPSWLRQHKKTLEQYQVSSSTRAFTSIRSRVDADIGAA